MTQSIAGSRQVARPALWVRENARQNFANPHTTVLPFETTVLVRADFDSAADIGYERWLEHEGRSGFIVYDVDEFRRIGIAPNLWFAS